MGVVRRRVFTKEFKREAVEKVISSGLSASAVAAEIGVHETVLRRWMASFQPRPPADTSDSEKIPPHLELLTENARLRTENERLRMERETLKKALAIVFAELH